MISFYLTSLPLDKESENDFLLRNVYVKKRVFQFYICFFPKFGKLFELNLWGQNNGFDNVVIMRSKHDDV